MAKKIKPGYKVIQPKFRPSCEIPNSWELSKFGQEISMEYGKGLTENNRTHVGYSVYGSGGKIDEHENFLVSGPGLIIGRKGTLGTVFFEEENFWPIDTAYYITQTISNFELHYLFYYLKFLKLELYKIVTSKPGISRDEIYSINIVKPPIDEQKKISLMLSNLDKLIDSYDKSIEMSMTLKKSLMQQLLTKGIGPKKFKKIKTLFGKFEKIPEEWEVKTFDKLFEFLMTGSNPRQDLGKDGGIHYIHYGDIHTKWNRFILDCNIEKIPQIEKNKVEQLPLLKEGDLIIADASEDYEGSGASVLLKNIKNKKIVAGLHTFALRTDEEKIALDFRIHVILGQFVKRQIVSYVTGTSVYGLSKNNLKKITICLPRIEEQEKIGSILSNVDEKINDLEKKKSVIENLKKGLMQKLLSGQLRVTA